jgi:hypothetical protein
LSGAAQGADTPTRTLGTGTLGGGAAGRREVLRIGSDSYRTLPGAAAAGRLSAVARALMGRWFLVEAALCVRWPDGGRISLSSMPTACVAPIKKMTPRNAGKMARSTVPIE